MKTTLRFGAGALVAAAAISGVAPGLGALDAGASTTGAPSRAFVAAKAKCTVEIDKRVWSLGVAKARIDASRRLTGDQKAAIDTTIVATYDNLVGVNRPAVRAATTRGALEAACRAVFADNRVYLVVLPEVIYAGQIDALGNAVDLLTTASQTKAATGADTSAVDAGIASANAAISDSAAQLATVTVASWNADPAASRVTFDAVKAQNFGAFVNLLQAKHLLDQL